MRSIRMVMARVEYSLSLWWPYAARLCPYGLKEARDWQLVCGLFIMISNLWSLTCSYMVMPFHVLNIVVVLGVRSGAGLVASFRLLPRCVIRVSKETFSWPKTDVISCACFLWFLKSVLSTWRVISPPSLTRAPLARRFRAVGRPSWLP